MKAFLFWIKVVLTYVIIICGVLIVFPNNKDFAVFLTNYIDPLAYVTTLSIIVDVVVEKKGDE